MYARLFGTILGNHAQFTADVATVKQTQQWVIHILHFLRQIQQNVDDLRIVGNMKISDCL